MASDSGQGEVSGLPNGSTLNRPGLRKLLLVRPDGLRARQQQPLLDRIREIVVAGGLGSLTGSIIGSAVITVLLEWLRFVENPIDIGSFHLDGIPGMRMVIFSLLLILIILFRREGIMGMREFSWDSLINRFSRGGEAR